MTKKVILKKIPSDRSSFSIITNSLLTSTMFLMTNLRMALSFGTHCKGQIYLIQEKLNILSGFTARFQDNLCMKTLEQLVQRTYLT